MDEDRFEDFIKEVKLMIHMYNNAKPASAEELRDELAESLDDIMRGTY